MEYWSSKSLASKRDCVVPENIHTPLPLKEGIGNSRGEGGQRLRNYTF